MVEIVSRTHGGMKMTFETQKEHEFWLLAKKLPPRTGKWEHGDLFVRRPYVDEPGKWADEKIMSAGWEHMRYDLIDEDAVWLPRLDQILEAIEELDPGTPHHFIILSPDGWEYNWRKWSGPTKEFAALKAWLELIRKRDGPGVSIRHDVDDESKRICSFLYNKKWYTRFSYQIYKYRELDYTEDRWQEITTKMVEAGLFKLWYEISCIECAVSVASFTEDEELPEEIRCEHCGTEFEPRDFMDANFREVWFAFTDELMETMEDVE